LAFLLCLMVAPAWREAATHTTSPGSLASDMARLSLATLCFSRLGHILVSIPIR
jgi:hypothetical protein